MKKATLIVVLVLLAAAPAFGAVLGTKHDLKTYITSGTAQTCVFCHTPHQPTGQSTDPLWNHTLSSAAPGGYGVYSSSTMNASPTQFTSTPLAGQTSALCMSCHDGTVARASMYNTPNNSTIGASVAIGGTANIGTDLSNDHPVNFSYAAAISGGDTGLVASPPASWLIGGFVQCSSCHDPHDNTNSPFLNTSNTNSALCTGCHVK